MTHLHLILYYVWFAFVFIATLVLAYALSADFAYGAAWVAVVLGVQRRILK